MMEAIKPLPEHRLLKRLVGTWSVTASDQQWTEVVRSLNDVWFIAEANAEMPGAGATTTVMTLGYNALKGKYLGTWIGSMMDHMWVYEGEVSPDGKVLTLYTRGPDFQTEGVEQDYREDMAFIDDNTRTFTSSAKQADGSWKQFMEARYVRVP